MATLRANAGNRNRVVPNPHTHLTPNPNHTTIPKQQRKFQLRNPNPNPNPHPPNPNPPNLNVAANNPIDCSMCEEHFQPGEFKGYFEHVKASHTGALICQTKRCVVALNNGHAARTHKDATSHKTARTPKQMLKLLKLKELK